MISFTLIPIFLVPLILNLRFTVVSSTSFFLLYGLFGSLVPFALVEWGWRDSKLNFVADISSSNAVVAMVCLSFAVGIAWWVSNTVVGRAARTEGNIFVVNNKTALRLTIAASVAGLGYMGIALLVFGGPEAFLQAMFQRVKIEDSTINYAGVLFWCAYVFSIASYHFSDWPRMSDPMKAFMGLQILFISVLSFSLGGRSIVVFYLVGLSMKHLIVATQRAQLRTLLVLGLLTGILSTLLISLRYEAQGAHAAYSGESAISTAVTGLTFIDHVTLSMNYADEMGLDYGSGYLQLPFMVIPRSLWIDKPLPLSQIMRGFAFGDRTGGVPPGLFGEAAIAFGPIGIVLVGGLLGLALGKVDANLHFARRHRCALRGAFVAVAAPLISFALVRGGADIGIFRVLIPLFWCGFLYIFVSSDSRIAVRLRRTPAKDA